MPIAGSSEQGSVNPGQKRARGRLKFRANSATPPDSDTATAQAQYRCIQPGGTVSYQQMPCAADSQAKRTELSPSATSAPGGSEGHTDWAAVIRGKSQGGDEPASAASKSASCPTPQQIKSMEHEASKLSNRRNSGMQGDLARARACR
jgi:hypothetical protein